MNAMNFTLETKHFTHGGVMEFSIFQGNFSNSRRATGVIN